jgi:2-keto-4-pentenoate hydratase/2-oxohepta-3-ene-1,7-dioic acid hydratase in catechol pathway
MRIACVLHDASPEPDGTALSPTLALERDGALYGVSALARAFGPRYAALAEAADFHPTVVALGGATLCELDERLKAGERPSSARLLPGSFSWLPPCDIERAALIECAPGAADSTPPREEPSYRFGSARTLLGHEATVPFPAGETEPDVACKIAVVLADDLWRATAAEAERSLLGYTLLLGWTARAAYQRLAARGESTAPATSFAAQLGPVLVTPDEAGAACALRMQLRVEGVPSALCAAGAWAFSPAESIAWISQHTPLRAGDVIGLDLVRGGAADAGVSLPYGARVELAVERLGRLSGRPLPGPPPRAWRSGSTGGE